jgi:excisionase family DNA binding protein
MKDSYTIQELAAAFSVGPRTFYGELKRGELHGVKVQGRWQISRTALEEYLRRHTSGGTREFTPQQQRQLAKIRARLQRRIRERHTQEPHDHGRSAKHQDGSSYDEKVG